MRRRTPAGLLVSTTAQCVHGTVEFQPPCSQLVQHHPAELHRIIVLLKDTAQETQIFDPMALSTDTDSTTNTDNTW